ncbi:MAG: PadR family transcriptional regulator [Bacteroidales bacterium]|nr:PadR family transcriptional regulator [Bacteroidales bacterium]
MSLKHTILGFLDNQELSGYDLQKKIETTINHFWPSTQSQIYRTLKELIDARQVDMRIIYQDEKPNKKVYSLTPRGKKELIEWLKSDIDLPNHRNQFLVQFFFSDCIDSKTIIKNLKHYKSIMQQRLSFMTYPETKKHIKGIQNNKRQELVSLIAQNGIWALENEIRWIEHAIKTLKK